MSSQAELYRRAAECERLMDLAPDPKTKQLFKQVREMWIALADESPDLPSRVIAASIAGIEEMQSTFEDFVLTEVRQPVEA